MPLEQTEFYELINDNDWKGLWREYEALYKGTLSLAEAVVEILSGAGDGAEMLTEQLKEAKEELDKVKEENGKLKAQLHICFRETQEKIGSAARDFRAASEHISELKEQLEVLKDENTDLREANKRLQSDFTAASDRVSELENDLAVIYQSTSLAERRELAQRVAVMLLAEDYEGDHSK